MTYEEVKRIRQNPTLDDIDNKELAEMIDNAIEKQIPKKPVDKSIENIKFMLCPCCGNNNILSLDKYCSDCGQALDWSDTE